MAHTKGPKEFLDFLQAHRAGDVVTTGLRADSSSLDAICIKQAALPKPPLEVGGTLWR